MAWGGSKACPGGLLTRFLAMGGRPDSSETEFGITILELKSDLREFHKKCEISNSVSEEPGRPPTARNRVRSPPGHAFEPPRAISLDPEQLSLFWKFWISPSSPPSIFAFFTQNRELEFGF